MEKEQLEKRKVITVKGASSKAYFDLMLEVQKAVKEGYVFPSEDKRWAKDTPKLVGRQLTVFMYPEDYDIPAPGVKSDKKSEVQAMYLEQAREADLKHKELTDKSQEIIEALKSLTKKDELLDYAKSIGLEIPEDKVQPKAIKAFILQSVK